MKVKVMWFPICHCRIERDTKENATPEDIEQCVNEFCTSASVLRVLSISCTQVTVRQHNNGGFDQVELWYNIFYEEKAPRRAVTEASQ